MLVRSSKWEGTPCPKCGSKKLQKKLSVFASSGGAEDAQPVALGADAVVGQVDPVDQDRVGVDPIGGRAPVGERVG